MARKPKTAKTSDLSTLYSRVRRTNQPHGMRGTVIPPDPVPENAVTVRWDDGTKQIVSKTELESAQ